MTAHQPVLNPICQKFRDLVDVSLNRPEEEFVATHRQTCEACQGYMADLAALTQSLHQLPEESPPKDFVDQVMSRLSAEPVPEAPATVRQQQPFPRLSVQADRPIPWWKPTAAAVALVALTYGLLVLFQPVTQPTESSQMAAANNTEPQPIAQPRTSDTGNGSEEKITPSQTLDPFTLAGETEEEFLLEEDPTIAFVGF